MPPSATTLVKICGFTSPWEAVQAVEAGADWIGLNFHPDSPRYVTPERAQAIIDTLPPTCQPVGLFVDRPAQEVRELAGRLGLAIVQLHGGESVDELASLQGLQVVRAYRLGALADIDRMNDDLDRATRRGCAPHAVLVDAFVSGQPGGTGHTVSDDLLAHLPRIPRLILAGGLTPENVAQRIARVRPWMVDVASGVESSPGRKDPTRMAAFIRAARSA